jgi:hypothetical protein
MESVLIAWAFSQSWMQKAMSSGPLSLRRSSDIPWWAMAASTNRYDVDGSDRPPKMNGKALPGVFVQQGKDSKAASIFCLLSRSQLQTWPNEQESAGHVRRDEIFPSECKGGESFGARRWCVRPSRVVCSIAGLDGLGLESD